MTTTDHRAEAERAVSVAPHADGSTAIAAIATAHALLAIYDLLASHLDRAHDEQVEQTATLHAIRDRLPEPTGGDAPHRCQAKSSSGYSCLLLASHDGRHAAYDGDVRGLESWWEREPAPEPRTWALPEEPPVGTCVIGSDGDAWERDRDGWRWFSREDEWGIEKTWDYILRYRAPLREATPDDLARLGIEDPS